MQRPRLTSVVLFILFSLIACRPAATAEPSVTPSLEELSSTPTPVPTSTGTLTPTSINTRTATRTPLPTIQEANRVNHVLNLMETNGGCVFPCWWGITPGETSVEQTRQLLEPFAEEVNLLESGNLGFIFLLPEDVYEADRIGVTIIPENQIVSKIQIGNLDNNSIDKILSQHGMPSQIMLMVLSFHSIDPEASYEVVLFYEDRGILAVFEGETEKSERLQICPKGFLNPDQPRLILWNPKLYLEFDDLTGEWPLSDIDDYYGLRRLSEINKTMFFEIFEPPSSKESCFEIIDPDFPK